MYQMHKMHNALEIMDLNHISRTYKIQSCIFAHNEIIHWIYLFIILIAHLTSKMAIVLVLRLRQVSGSILNTSEST